MRARAWKRATGIGFLGALLALFLLWPLAESVRGAFIDPNGAFTLAYLVGVFRNPIYLAGFRNSLAIGLLATAIADEARGLALAAEVTSEVTYLGAHVVPPEFTGDWLVTA